MVNSQRLRRPVVAGWLFCTFFFLQVPELCASDETVDFIERQLNESAKQLSPITLEWTVKRSSSMHELELMTLLRYAEHDSIEFFGERRVTFRWQDEMMYQYIRGTSVKLPTKPGLKDVPKIPFGREYAFNHEYVYLGDAETETTKAGLVPMLVVDLVKGSIERRATDKIFTPEYLFAAGYWVPSLFEDLGKPATSQWTQLHSDGGVNHSISDVSIGEIQCVQAQIELNGVRTVFAFDPRRAYAMLRREDFDIKKNTLIQRTNASEFKQVADRLLWLPERIVVSQFIQDSKRLPSGSPLYINSYSLTALGTQVIPLDAFILHYRTPGTIIVDYNLPEARETRKGYVISASADDL